MARNSKDDARRARHIRLRKKIAGTSERPRLLVRRTLHHIYATLVDDAKGHTLAAVTCPSCNERFSVDLAGGRLGES